MKILILGGTAWLGNTAAKAAVAAGHEVTCLARGSSVPDGVRLIRADRDDDAGLAPVAGEPWDAVIDVARQPIHVRRAVRDLKAARCIFVSTGNVYASQSEVGAVEDAARLAPLEADVMSGPEDYGPAKVACESAVRSGFGDDAVIVRSGLIAGPGDDTGRTTYWVRRFARPSGPSSAVLVPQTNLPTFNAMGVPVPFADHIAAARKVAGHRGPVIGPPEDWLAEQGVHEWSGERSLPLWLRDRNWYGMNARSTTRAGAAGLMLRPLHETLAHILAEEPPLEPDVTLAGLSDDDEQRLLALLCGSAR
ncbi:MAG: NAD-dependent epimerase/dehydratase family protein [Arthrobacter sp.]